MSLKLVTSLDTVAECLNRRWLGARLMKDGSSEELLASLLPAHVTWEESDLKSGGQWWAFELVDAEGRSINTVWIRKVN